MNVRDVLGKRTCKFACLVLIVSVMFLSGLNAKQANNKVEGNLRVDSFVDQSKGICAVNYTGMNVTLPWSAVGAENFTWLNFTFTWGPDSQRIVEGAFWLNVSICFRTVTMMNSTDFSPVGVFQDLVVVVETNVDGYNDWDSMGFAFDTNQNGYIDTEDRAYVAFANNETRLALLNDNGFLAVETGFPEPSCHQVTFDPVKGYTFMYYPYGDPRNGGNFMQYLRRGGDNPLHICFSKPANGKGVFVRFLFNIPSDWIV